MRRFAEFEVIVSKMCQGSTRNSNFTLDAGLKAVVEGIPLEGSLGFSSTEAKADYLCQNYSTLRNANISLDTYSREVQIDALSNFNTCIELAQRGIGVRASALGLDGFQVQVTKADQDPFRLRGFTSSENVSCVSAQISEGNQTLSSTTEYEFPTDFTISCTRTPAANGTHFDPGYISLTTSRSTSPFVFRFDQDEQLTPATASQARQDLAAASLRMETLRQEFQDYKDQVGKYRLQTTMMHYGENAHTGFGGTFSGQFMPCGADPSAFARDSICPGAIKWQMDQVQVSSGGVCGSGVAHWVVSCLYAE